MALVEEYTQSVKRLDPFWAPYFDLEEGLDQFGDYPSADYFKRSEELVRTTWEELNKTIQREELSESEQLVYDLFSESLAVELAQIELPNRYFDFNQMSSRALEFIGEATPAVSSFPFKTQSHFEAWLKRVSGFPSYVDREIALIREGISKGYTHNCIIVDKIRSSYQEALSEDLAVNPFMRPLKVLPESISAREKASFEERFAVATRSQVIAPMQKLDRFVAGEVKKACRKSYGLSGLPMAKELYAHRVWVSTNLKSVSAEEIHQIGLAEVSRIKSEIMQIARKRGYKGTLVRFLESRRNDESNYFKSAKEVVQTFHSVRASIDPLLHSYFKEVPKTPYKIVEGENPEDAAASYRQPTDTIPYGRFVLNTKNLKANQRSGVTTLSLHEANPGHHLQLAIQFEKKEQLSEYQRKIYYSNAFAEGWALYAERLGREMGLFKDDEQLLGHLNDEMLRAVRLVVDTGIHAKGWSRGRALKYMLSHMVGDRRGIEIEVDRYSVWPGQALGYKMGQLKILELRKRAELELGKEFDIREFHHQVLGTGTISLAVLERKVDRWIKEQSAN